MLNTESSVNKKREKSYDLIIAGGGTGGHLYPGVAVAEVIKKTGKNSFFYVSDRGLERKALTKLDYDFYEQASCPLKGIGLFGKIRSVLLLSKEMMKAFFSIKRKDVVLLTGGFAAAAPAFAARMKGAKLYLHEQNSVMGMTNKYFAKKCRKVFLSFEDTENAAGNSVFTGNPVRGDFLKFAPKEAAGKKLLILGGSQGSRFINFLVAKSAKELIARGYEITHQAGGKLLVETKEKYKELGLDPEKDVKLVPFIDDMMGAYEKADVVIARSGSGSVYETMYAKRPALLIPFKAAADNHQFFNAKYAEKKGVAKVLTEDEATPEKLAGMLADIFEKHEEFVKNFENIEYLRSAEIIVKEMGLLEE